MLRFLLWRLLGLLALLVGFAAVGWLLGGGPGRALRGASAHVVPIGVRSLVDVFLRTPGEVWDWAPLAGVRLTRVSIVLGAVQAVALLGIRWLARSRRSYVRMSVETYRTDQASAEAVVRMHEALHKRLLHRWWRRALLGQPSFALEIHHECVGTGATVGSRAWLALSCPAGLERMAEAALRTAYPNCRLTPVQSVGDLPTRAVVRLRRTRVHPKSEVARPFRARARTGGEQAADRNGSLSLAGLCATRSDTRSSVVRAHRAPSVQAAGGAFVA